MAGYFAELKNNIVQRVISAETKEWCVNNLGGEWVQTYYSTTGKQYASEGFTYHPEKDNFSPPQPYSSWSLDKNLVWQPPVPMPIDGKSYEWSEGTLSWNKYTPIWQQ